MAFIRIFLLFNLSYLTVADLILSNNNFYKEDIKVLMLSTLIKENIQSNGRNTILMVGVFPDVFYRELQEMRVAFTITDIEETDEQIEDVVPYPSNTIILNCHTLKQFEQAMFKLITLPYWHPLANVILYYHIPYEKNIVANLFYVFWYFKAINAIIVQYDDLKEFVYVSYYNPYMSDYYKLENTHGCWTSRKISIPVDDIEAGIQCVEGCRNISMYSSLRINNLGTCIGFNSYTVNYYDLENLKDMILFEDKSLNYHNYTMLSFAIEIKPFLEIESDGNGTYKIYKRDAMIWNTMAEVMNFTIDISVNKDILYESFNYELNIREIYYFTQRKRDLVLLPIYQFDIMVVQLDNTVPFVDSGVCFMSHRAGFETIIFDRNFILKNSSVILEFFLCFLCTWLVFVIFTIEQTRTFSMDQVGKDLVNSFRTILSISLHKPPKHGSFKIFLGIAIWSFFVINFSSQAAIISLFSVLKKGKEVDTFEDILEKGYQIEGIASPDVVLPDNEERFRKINNRMVAVQNMYICPERMKNDSERFCIIDCAFGRYLERNWLNYKGEQYLHVAKQDRIHSHYLQMVLHKHSPMTERYNRVMLALFEAGIMKKWMDYRFDDIKEETPLKALAMKDLIGLFQCYAFLLGVCALVFIFEMLLGLNLKRGVKYN